MKKVLSLILAFVFVVGICASAPITITANAADASHIVDAATAISRTNVLVNSLVGKYFTTTQSTCGNSCCDKCKNSNIIGTTWLKNTMDLIPNSVSLLPEHYYSSSSCITSTAWSCAGFANYCLWYIYAKNPSDNVRRVNIYTGKFTETDLDKSGVRTGDVIRVDDHHSFVYISHNNSGVTVLDSNWDSARHNLVQKHVIKWTWRSGTTMAITRGKNWTDSHTHVLGSESYESVHPHRIYKKCTGCSYVEYTGATKTLSTCSSCTPKDYVVTVWASEKGKGYQYNECPSITNGVVGNRYYLWYKMYDKNSGDLYNENKNYTATISIYYPDGSLWYSADYTNSPSNWISVVPSKIGSYKMNIKLSGDISADYSRYFNISSDGFISFDKTSIELTLPTKQSDTIVATLGGNWPNGARVEADYDSSIIDYNLVDKTFTITGKRAGVTSFSVIIKDENENVLAAADCEITVKNETYSVKFNGNGGEGGPKLQIKTYGQDLVISEQKPDKKGYIFSCWNSKPDGSGTAIMPGSVYKQDQNMLLYAYYKPIEYTVVYNSNGGEGSTSSSKHTYDLNQALTINKYKREGYTFLGWSTNATDICPIYLDGEDVENLTTIAKDTIVLYAIWEPVHSCSYSATITTNPSCTSNGIKTYECSCGKSYTETIPAKGHSFGSTPTSTKNPTCVTTGLKTYTCVVCGGTKTESIPVIPHTKSGWMIDKAATVTELGSKHIECTVCKKVLETGTIEKLPLSAPTTSATNTQNGIKVTWNAVEGAESYKIFRKQLNGNTWSAWTSPANGITGTSYVDETVKFGVTYIYAVVAVNESVTSSFIQSSQLTYSVAPTVTIANGTDGIKVTWNAVSGATSYKVFRRQLNGSSWSAWSSPASGLTTTSYVDKTAKLGVTYSYAVVAVNGSSTSSFVATEGLKADITATVTATSTTSGINLNWNSVNGATGYTIYRKALNATDNTWSAWSVLKTGYTGTTYNDAIGNLGVTYIYCVRATVGSFSGSYVQSAQVKCNMAPKVTISNTAEGIKVEWSKVFGATSYKVFRRELNANNTWSAWSSPASGLTGNAYVDKNIKYGVTYSYAVIATNGTLSSSYIATAGLKCNVNPVPVAPTVTIANGTDGIKVTWNAVSGATSYKVFRRQLNADNTWSAWSSPASGLTATSYVDKTVNLGVTYSYAVVATNSAGSSNYVATSGLKCNIAPTVKIADSTEGIKVTWNKINGAVTYKVFRRQLNADNTWGAWSSPASGLTTTSYVDKTAKFGTKYSYAVVAVNNSISSSYVATSALQCGTAPTVTIGSDAKGIRINWSTVSGADSYIVYKKIYNATTGTWGGWVTVAQGAKGTTTVDTGVVNGTYYIYTVRASKDGFNGSFVQSNVAKYVK